MKRTLLALVACIAWVQSVWSGYEGQWTVKTLAGSWDESGYADGTRSSARFGFIGGIVTDASGNVFVADTTNHRIRKVTSTGVVTTFAGSTRGSKEGTGAAAQFSFPEQIAIDKSGNLYVSETTGYANESPTYRIRKITSTGATSTLKTGSGVIQSMAVYGTTTLNLAYSLRENYDDARVWRLATTGGTPSALTRDGETLYSNQLASNSSGHLFVASQYDPQVWRLAAENWTNIDLQTTSQGGPNLGALASNRTGDELFFPSSVEVDISEGLFRFTESANSSSQVLDNRNPYYDELTERTREGRALQSLSNGGYIDSVAISQTGIVYFTERTRTYSDAHEGMIWKTSYFWNAISKNLITDLSDLTGEAPIPGTEDTNPIYWGPWDLSQNSAIRQLIPIEYTVNYPDSISLSTGQSIDPLNVETNSEPPPKFQWYRSGMKISGATSKEHTPGTAGVYNLEITYGTGTDSAVVVTPPCVITAVDAATTQSRGLLQNVNESNWASVMNQVVANTKTSAAKGGDSAFLNGMAGATLALRDLETSGLLAKLGFTGNPNPLAWTVTHSGELPDGVLSADARAFLIAKVYPRLLEADTQLGRVTDKNFVTPFPSSNTFQAEGIYADFGDIQLMRALLKGGMWAIKWLEGMNTDFAVDDLRNAYAGGKLSLEWILAKYPLLLGTGTSSAVAASIGHLKAALDCYFAWSDFVKGPTATAQGRMQSLESNGTNPFLFSLAPEDLADESRVRAELKNTRTALDSKGNQSIPLVFKDSDEEPLFGLLGAKAGSYSLNTNPLALLSRPTGWRSEFVSLAFTKNLAKNGTLTSTSNAANKTLKSILPDLSNADFLKIATGLTDSEPFLNEKWNTRWDTEPPTVTMNPIGTGGKASPNEDGTIAVSGTIRDGSTVTSVFVKRKSDDGREEVVDGVITEQPGSLDRNRIYTWQAWVPLSAGKNVITASAVDSWGQTTDKPASQTIQAEIKYAVTIDQEGEGVVTSTASGPTVAGGTTIDIKVTPAKNWVFRHFEIYMDGEELDRVTATSLKLKVAGETRIVPIFEPDPFRFMTGPVTLTRRVFEVDSADMNNFDIPLSILTVTVNKTGSISGKLRVGRQLYPFTTRFNADNTTELSFRPQLPLKSRDSAGMTKRMSSLSVRLALRTEADTTVVLFSHESPYSSSPDPDGGNNELRNLGELRPVPLSSNMVFNGSVTDSASDYDDFIHLRISTLGISSCTGILGNGERYSASAPVFYGETNDSMGPDDSINGATSKIRATLQPVTTNKYTVMASEVIFYPPSYDSGPDESLLWRARTTFEGERWASNNRWPVDASGKSYTPTSSDSDWKYLNSDSSMQAWIPQFLPATEYSFGAFSPESSFASVSARPFTNLNGGEESYRVGYLKWISSSILLDLDRMMERGQDYPEMIISGTSRMTFTVNRSTGLFSAKAGWRQDNDQTNTRTLIAPKTFTGVLVAPSMNGPSDQWGIGKSSDGSTLSVSWDDAP